MTITTSTPTTRTAPAEASARTPLISRANAAFFATFDGYIDRVADDHKRHALAGLPAGNIVEIGAGVGANFDHLPPGSTVTAIEPNPAMHSRLIERAAERHIPLDVVDTGAETMPFDDGSVDVVISTLVLCTVDDQDAALAEIRRILRPGGTFRFVEHVAAPATSPRSWLQRALRRPWSWAFEGCDLRRHTADAIRRAGFASVDIEEHRFRRSVFVPVNAAISGIATR
jgi:ubiquinone/menaquinone biosynthesis C-methylase UbiE